MGGENYWIYGYLIMYLVIGAFLSKQIAVRMFPFNDRSAVDFAALKPKEKQYIDVSRKPEFILLAMTICLAVVIFLTVTFKPKGVGFGEINLLGTDLTYDIASFACVFVVISVFVFQCTYRSYVRKISGISGRVYVYLVNKKVDSFAISMIFCYLILLAWTVTVYNATKTGLVLIIGIFFPAIGIFYALGFLWY